MNKFSGPNSIDERCENCTKPGVVLRLIAEVYDGILIEGIPQYACPHCGERYITSETQQAIDDIRANPQLHTTEKLIRAAALA